MTTQKIDFQRILAIEQPSKDTVLGFLRTISEEACPDIRNAYYNIPPLVSRLCLLFWFEQLDEFDPDLCGQDIEVFNNNKSARTSKLSKPSFGTVYGKLIVDSMVNRVYVWKFTIVGGYCGCLNIGIDNAVAKWTTTGFHNMCEKAYYSLFTLHGEVSSWQQQCIDSRVHMKSGDKLTMRVEFGENAIGLKHCR